MSNERRDISMPAAPREDTRLLYVSTSRFGGDWHSTPHTHNCTELFYCMRGAGQFDIGGTLHPVEPDDLVIVNPQVEHTEVSLNANPLEYIVLGIEGIEFLFHKGSADYALMSCRDTSEEMRFLLTGMLREIDERLDGFETVCQDFLDILLIRLVRADSFSLQKVQKPSRNKECLVVKRYIDEHYTENLSLDMLAQLAHVNKFHLAHAFQREYNLSPINYLIRRRIRESEYLLGNTDYSLSQISVLMGFSSASYFSQSFRRVKSMTPNEYRKRVRSGEEHLPEDGDEL